MEIKEFIPIALFILTIAGIIANHFKAKGMDQAQQKIIDEKLAKLELIDDKQWKEIDKGREWENTHEREASEIRNSLEIKIALLQGGHDKLEAMFKVIDKKLDTLIIDMKKPNG